MGKLSKRKNAIKLLEQLDRISMVFDQATPYLIMVLGLFLIFIFFPMLISYSSSLRGFENMLKENPRTAHFAEIVLARAMYDILLSIVLLGLSAICVGYLSMKPKIKNKFWESPATKKFGLQAIVIIFVVFIEIVVAILDLIDEYGVVDIAFYALLKGYDVLLFTLSKLILLIASIAVITFAIPILYFYFSKIFRRLKSLKKITVQRSS